MSVIINWEMENCDEVLLEINIKSFHFQSYFFDILKKKLSIFNKSRFFVQSTIDIMESCQFFSLKKVYELCFMLLRK